MISICLSFNATGQTDFSKQIPRATKYTPEEIIDPTYGITIYEPLNFRLGGDSARYCQGYSCSGWIEDFYVSDKLLHKGYYVEGQLKIYKNYYPDGILEREYRVIDDYKSLMKLYYPSSQLKSEVRYVDGQAKKWTDYYPNGQMDYYEEYDKHFEYYVAQNSYYEDGTPEALFKLESKKKLTFTKKEYHKNGQVKEEGMVAYNVDLFDYQKIGKWSIYDESGKLTREETYLHGKINKEKDY